MASLFHVKRGCILPVLFKNIICAFVFSLIIFAGVTAPAQESVNLNDSAYLDMISLSKAMKEDFDFAAVRKIYSQTSFFNPYAVMPKTDVPVLFKNAQTGNPAALHALEDYKRDNFPLIEMHSGYMNYYEALKRADQAAYHKWMVTGLIGALLQSGDGSSPETAVDVLNIGEEYMLAKNIRMDVTGQRIENKDGRVYDVLEGIIPVSGKKRELWFDITAIFAKGPY